MNEKKVYIVIPAFNEEKNISFVIDKLKKLYTNIVVVDDCSSDNTHSILKTLGIHVLRHPVNRGQGAALETGDSFAIKNGADIIVHFDADGQFKVSDIEKIIEPIISDEVDIVMGSRFMGIETNMPAFKRKFIMPIARLVLKLLYGTILTDPQSGFRAFNKKYASELKIENDGAAHCTEIIANTLKNNWRYREVPISVHYDKFGQGIFSGKGRGAGGIKILKSLFLQKLIK